jgi:hypothetical protein
MRQDKLRILYIITSIAEFDTGRRNTVTGYDRFSNTIVPVSRESVTSMVQAGYAVDVYLIAHYNVSVSRYEELASQLPATVGLQVWDDATPIGYASEQAKAKIRIMSVTRGLSRQHRYVVKDKISHYDLVLCFEDDMLVRGEHVAHFANVTDALYQLRPLQSSSTKVAMDQFYGPMTSRQLARIIPGFMRVEAALNGFEPPANNLYEQIPIDYRWSDQVGEASIDPSICCSVSAETAHARRPISPDKDELFFWETSIDALGVRKMPNQGPSALLSWAVLLGGANNELFIGDYWSGRGATAYFGNTTRPDRKRGRYVSNQGGWMATKRQIFEWHFTLCRGGFLP